MNLLLLLNETSPWVVALGLVAVAEVYSIGLMLLFRTRMGAERLALNNEVAGFKFAVVGVFYAVLLAFVVVAVWEDYHDTETAVRNEAKALSRSASGFLRAAGGRRATPCASISSPIPSRFATSNGRRWRRVRQAAARQTNCTISAKRSCRE